MSLPSSESALPARHQGPAGPRAPADVDPGSLNNPLHPHPGGEQCRAGSRAECLWSPTCHGRGHSAEWSETDVTLALSMAQLFPPTAPTTLQPTLHLSAPTLWDAGGGCRHHDLARGSKKKKNPPGENIVKNVIFPLGDNDQLGAIPFGPGPALAHSGVLLAEVLLCTLALFTGRCRMRPHGSSHPFRLAGLPPEPTGTARLPVHPSPRQPRPGPANKDNPSWGWGAQGEGVAPLLTGEQALVGVSRGVNASRRREAPSLPASSPERGAGKGN